MDDDAQPHASLHLHAATARAGPQRMALLRAIAEHGSISAAARAAGLTYRGAWDGVQAVNNLFGRPLVTAQAGGAAGGGAALTPAGRLVLEAVTRVETRLSELVTELHAALDGPTLLGGSIWSLGMKTSARNALRGVVEHVAEGAVNSEVTLRVSPEVAVTAVVTRESVAELGLVVGREAIALIKSSFVIVAPGDAPLRTSARNRFVGHVAHHIEGSVNDEVTLEFDAGKTLTATITRGSGEALGLKPGSRAQALVKASHVILAVE